MITKTSPNLSTKYLTTLEVGGAYSHRFTELMAFLHIPYLVITDIDSVKPPEGGGRAKACCAADADAVTSNASLKDMFTGKLLISDFNEMPLQDQSQTEFDRFVAFQRPVEVDFLGEHMMIHGRTLEETFIYENIQVFGEGETFKSVVLPAVAEELNESMYKLIRESSFKKTDFALTVLSSDDWQVPLYIREGLEWLELRLQSPDQVIEGPAI